MHARACAIRILGALILGVLSACARQEAAMSAAPPSAEGPPVSVQQTPAGTPAAPKGLQKAERTLAYEHVVQIELPEQMLAPRSREVQQACESRAELGCTLLDLQVDEDAQAPSARITLKVAPGQVDALVNVAARGGKILSRTTHAQDLAQPIADTDRQMALLTMHRDRLSEFLQRKDLKIEQVIELSHEIASAQADIESLNGQKTALRQRVDTERLTLQLSPPGGVHEPVETPVLNALQAFGPDFAATLGLVIRFFAVILPLLLIGVPVAALVWWLRRRRAAD